MSWETFEYNIFVNTNTSILREHNSMSIKKANGNRIEFKGRMPYWFAQLPIWYNLNTSSMHVLSLLKTYVR